MASARHFSLRRGGVHCDTEGLRVGSVDLLARGVGGRWTPRVSSEIQRDLEAVYGHSIDLRSKRRGLETVAAALDSGEIARAQIAALLMQLPDPPPSSCSEADKRRLARDLAASGLLKADDDWDEQHPRTGSPPNPGWFAPKPKPEESTTADVDPVAYQGDFHDVVAAAEIEELRRTGALCISEARLTLGVATARIDILCRTKIGGLMGVEVKTGDDPSFTPSQIAVYFHSLLGGVSSPDAKITLLGFPPNEELPPFPIFLLYASGPNAPKRFLGPLKPPNGN